VKRDRPSLFHGLYHGLFQRVHGPLVGLVRSRVQRPVSLSGRGAGAVLHSHGKATVLASIIYEGSEFRIKDLEMIKGIYNPLERRMFRNDEELVIPIIENTCFEADLAQRMLDAMNAYPQSSAVIVRRHGIYVWGDSWQQCKTM
jgi:methylthioribulose-1-phosphate dehydratase